MYNGKKRMIDLEKFMQANDLVRKVSIKMNCRASISIIYENEGNFQCFEFKRDDFLPQYFNLIDLLLIYLDELITPPALYKQSQLVFYYDCDSDNPIRSLKITHIEWNKTKQYYEYNFHFPENKLFKNEGELIDNQLEYWQKIKINTLVEG